MAKNIPYPRGGGQKWLKEAWVKKFKKWENAPQGEKNKSRCKKIGLKGGGTKKS